MAAISKTTFSDAFSSMKMIAFRLTFHRLFFPKCQMSNIQTRRQAIIWADDGKFSSVA